MIARLQGYRMYGTSMVKCVIILVMKLKSKVVMGAPPTTTTLIGAKETIRTSENNGSGINKQRQ
jgi:hypothetical protein